MGKLMTLVELLRSSRDHGVDIRTNDDGTLMVRISRDDETSRRLVSQLSRNKSNMMEVLEGLEEKLRHGQEILVQMDRAIWDEGLRPSEKHVRSYLEYIDGWDLAEYIYHAYVSTECPIGYGGCDPDSPVLCRACGR